jgi:hypothetical protein
MDLLRCLVLALKVPTLISDVYPCNESGSSYKKSCHFQTNEGRETMAEAVRSQGPPWVCSWSSVMVDATRLALHL